jgi:hypothetical protein
MGDFNTKKFVFHETFTNTNGKSSGSGFVGVIMGLSVIAMAITIVVGWWLGKPEVLEMFEKIIQLGLLSAALLGVRKISGNFLNNGSGNGSGTIDASTNVSQKG